MEGEAEPGGDTAGQGRAGPICGEQQTWGTMGGTSAIEHCAGLGHRVSLFLLAPGLGVQAGVGTLQTWLHPRHQQPSQESLLPALCRVPGELPRAEGAGSAWLQEAGGGAGTAISGLWPLAEMG